MWGEREDKSGKSTNGSNIINLSSKDDHNKVHQFSMMQSPKQEAIKKKSSIEPYHHAL